MCGDIRGVRSHFDRQQGESEKKGLVIFLYEFAKFHKQVTLYKKLKNTVTGIEYLEQELENRGPNSIKITIHCGTNLASKDRLTIFF